jgi:predicted flap endonuclease-1-like 5' DNA nuclease
MAWPGVPGEALLRWLTAEAGLPAADGPASAQPAGPEPPAPVAGPELRGEPPTPTPPADDLKRINGINAAMEEQLNQAGIRTYAQLADSTTAELSALPGTPAARVTRGWITRARTLLKSRGAQGEASESAPALHATEPAARQAAVLHVEVRFSGDGEVLDHRILRDDHEASQSLDQTDEYIARFFIEQSSRLDDEAGALQRPAEVYLDTTPLQLEELPSTEDGGEARLRARSELSVSGIGAEQLLARGAAYCAYMLGYELQTGETKVLQGLDGQLRPGERNLPIEALLDVPQLGFYRMMLVVLLADHDALSVAMGPRLRVNP